MYLFMKVLCLTLPSPKERVPYLHGNQYILFSPLG